MPNNKVKTYFENHGLGDRISEFDSSSKTVELAAEAIGCDPKEIAKTLSFDLGGKPILIVASGDAKIANPKFKAEFNTKATMLSAEETKRLIGHAVGGVCPFVINEGVSVYLDISLKRFDSVYPACGSGNSVIKLTIKELEAHSGSVKWVDVCKGWS